MHMLAQASRDCKSSFSDYYNTIAGDLYGHFKITSLIHEVPRSVSFPYSILLAPSLIVQIIQVTDKNKKIWKGQKKNATKDVRCG